MTVEFSSASLTTLLTLLPASTGAVRSLMTFCAAMCTLPLAPITLPTLLSVPPISNLMSPLAWVLPPRLS